VKVAEGLMNEEIGSKKGRVSAIVLSFLKQSCRRIHELSRSLPLYSSSSSFTFDVLFQRHSLLLSVLDGVACHVPCRAAIYLILSLVKQKRKRKGGIKRKKTPVVSLTISSLEIDDSARCCNDID